MEYAAFTSSLERATVEKIEKDYLAYQQQCSEALWASRHTCNTRQMESPELFSLMLQTAAIHAPVFEASGSTFRAKLRARIKDLLRWVMRPFFKIALVHQQEMNHLVVLLAESHRILEQKVARLEAAAQSAEHRLER